MSDNAHNGQTSDRNLNLMNHIVDLGVDREFSTAETKMAQKREESVTPPEFTDAQKNKIKENTVKKMKQINAVITDFAANIEAIKLKMKDLDRVVGIVCLWNKEFYDKLSSNNKGIQI